MPRKSEADQENIRVTKTAHGLLPIGPEAGQVAVSGGCGESQHQNWNADSEWCCSWQPVTGKQTLATLGKCIYFCGVCLQKSEISFEFEKGRKKSLLSQRAVADFYLACDKQQSVVRVEKKDRKKSASVSENSWETGHPESSRYTTANNHTDIWHNAHTLALMHTCGHTHTQGSQRASSLWKQAVSHQSHQSFALSLLTFTHFTNHSFIFPLVLHASYPIFHLTLSSN